jgi:hypothetical protein
VITGDNVGAVRSIFTVGLVAEVEFPATSDTDAEADNEAPSPVIVEFAGHPPAMPEPSSEHDHPTVTSPANHPDDGVATDPDNDGATVSTRTTNEAEPVFPARSVHVAVNVCTPSPDDEDDDVHVAGSTPDPAPSDQFHATVTADEFQPDSFATGL